MTGSFWKKMNQNIRHEEDHPQVEAEIGACRRGPKAPIATRTRAHGVLHIGYPLTGCSWSPSLSNSLILLG